MKKIKFNNNNLPAISEEILEVLQDNVEDEFTRISAVTIYINTAGERGNINLLETVENFDFIEVFYKDVTDGARGCFSSVKIENPLQKYFNTKIFAPVKNSSSQLRYATTTFFINAKTIEVVDYVSGFIQNDTVSFYSSQEILIDKIIGYRKEM